MNRRSFLASSGVMLADQLLAHATHAWAAKRAAEKDLHVRQDRRYRMIFRNGSGDQHPMHPHRHTFEVTRVGTKELSM
jgi:FtsP/CotA-like multicopper oxidase with cupredoxin domain